METADFNNAAGETVDRLTAVKEVLDEFLTRREGDRVGLIVFGNAAFTQVPFTQDLEAARILLEETRVRMAGPRTAFGDAIGLAITLFEESEVEDRVVIALTDGNDTGSRVPPAEAARIAEDRGISIHVIGVGDPAAVGEEQLDEEALRTVAATTGGRYFHAADRDALQEIYAELDRIGTREVETATYRPRRDLFHWPLAVFLVLSLLVHAGLLLQRRAGTTGREHG
jgi:Ca-activated chloride channel family protein